MNRISLQTSDLKFEVDVVRIRQKARAFAEILGFDFQDQVRIATAVSEIARNAYEYAGGGRVEFALTENNPQRFQITVKDQGPGIQDLPSIFSGQYVSHTGMGVGMAGAKKLMDLMNVMPVKDGPGTIVVLEKLRPANLPDVSPLQISGLMNKMAQSPEIFPLAELQAQNKELYKALDELAQKQEALEKANQELESTNQGVLALYTELDEQALALKNANETKSAFLANMTHEFRSPLNSILNISSLLLDREIGVQNSEHYTQVQLIQKSASSLSILVNDLLDLAKVEAGKITVRPSQFSVGDLFSSLRGLMKPLLVPHQNVELTFEDSPDESLMTDEGKLSQILRNLISNALKYTEKGFVRISAQNVGTDRIAFHVVDSGIGISPEDQEKIFEEFYQAESSLQRNLKGTGLGLPLSDRLARLLGGRIEFESTLGSGSKFSLIVPKTYQGQGEADYISKKVATKKTEKSGVISPKDILIIDDEQGDRYFLQNMLNQLRVSSAGVDNGKDGFELAQKMQPRLIFLDLNMPDMNGFDVLKILMSHPKTKNIPVVIHSSQVLEKEELEYFKQISVECFPKSKENPENRIQELRHLLKKFDLHGKELSHEQHR